MNGQIFDYLKIDKNASNKLVTSTFLSLNKVQNYSIVANKYSLVWKLSYQDFI